MTPMQETEGRRAGDGAASAGRLELERIPEPSWRTKKARDAGDTASR